MTASPAAAFTEDADASAQNLVQAGAVNFDDIDGNDVVDISAALSSAATWSGGSIDPTLAAALEAGFSASATGAAAPGSVAWNYNVTGVDLDFLSAGESISLTFTVTATDGSAATASDTVTITINGTNDGPTVTASPAVAFTEAADASAQNLVQAGTVSFGDIDGNDVVDISAALTSSAVWSGGSIDPTLAAALEAGFSASATGAAAPGSVAWNYNVAGVDLDFLSAGESISLTFTVTATDGQAATATDTVTITINGTNDGPSVTASPAAAFNEDADASAQNLVQAGTVNFDDIDGNDVVDISAALSSSAVWSGGAIDPTLAAALEAGFSATATGAAAPGSVAWNYSVAGVDLDFLSAGESISLTFTVTATDGQAATATDTVTITINGTNDGPSVTASPAAAFTEDADASAQNLVQAGTVSFDDIDGNDVVDISAALSSAATWSGGSIDPTLAAALEAGFSATATGAAAPGSVAWNYNVAGVDLDFLSAGESITLTFTVTATDGSAATASDTVTVTINGTNDGPTVTASLAAAFTEDADASAQNLVQAGTVSFDDIDGNDVVDISAALSRRRSGAAAASTRPWPPRWKPASAQPPPVPPHRARWPGTTTSPASTSTS